MHSYAQTQQITKQEEIAITSLISELGKIQNQPEIQLNEFRSYTVLFRAIKKIIDNYDFDLVNFPGFKYKLARTYSDENQKNIFRDLKEIRNSLNQKFSDEIIRSFDMALSAVLKKHGISLKYYNEIKEKKENCLFYEKGSELKSSGSKWHKEGNFNIDKCICYYHDSNDSIIKEIRIFIHKNCNFVLHLNLIESKHHECYSVFQKHRLMRIKDGCYALTIQSLVHLESFLDTIEKIDPSLHNLTNNIIYEAEPYLKKSASVKGWEKIGNFNFKLSELNSIFKSLNYDNRLDKFIGYKSINPNTIEEIQLLEFGNGKIKLSLAIKENYYNEIISTLKKYNILESFLNQEKSLKKCSLYISSTKQLEEILILLQKKDPSIGYLMNDIILAYDTGYESSRKTAFLMGLHPKAGQDSPIFHALKKNEIAEQKLVGPILSFLFQPPEKEKSNTKRKLDEQNDRNSSFKSFSKGLN